MRELVLTSKFKREFRKFVGNDKQFKKRIDQVLLLMREDVFAPFLAAHKLGGIYKGFYACKCGYDCRITFSIEKRTREEEEIILLGIGSHDEIY